VSSISRPTGIATDRSVPRQASGARWPSLKPPRAEVSLRPGYQRDASDQKPAANQGRFLAGPCGYSGDSHPPGHLRFPRCSPSSRPRSRGTRDHRAGRAGDYKYRTLLCPVSWPCLPPVQYGNYRIWQAHDVVGHSFIGQLSGADQTSIDQCRCGLACCSLIHAAPSIAAVSSLKASRCRTAIFRRSGEVSGHLSAAVFLE
jgi:hypothetical protein